MRHTFGVDTTDQAVMTTPDSDAETELNRVLTQVRDERSPDKTVMGRGLSLLEAISRAGRPLSLAVLAEVTHLPKSTVFRLAGQLVELGVLERSEEGLSLGLRIFEWGSQAEKQRDLRRISVPYLTELHTRLGQTVHLGVLDGRDVVYVEKIESRAAIRCPTQVGGRRPAHATALGKAMLAFTPEAIALVLRDQLAMETNRTVVAPGSLHRQLLEARRTRVSVEIEESFLGVACVASPILDSSGVSLGAISISTSALRFDPRHYGAAALATAQRISAQLAQATARREQSGF